MEYWDRARKRWDNMIKDMFKKYLYFLKFLFLGMGPVFLVILLFATLGNFLAGTNTVLGIMYFVLLFLVLIYSAIRYIDYTIDKNWFTDFVDSF